MKTLLLTRHAKSSWKDASLSDRERPLNKRGKRDAPAMGELLRDRDLVPDLILSSPAVRAYKTARKIAKAVGYDPKRIRVHEGIYLGGVDGLLEVIRDIDGQAARACLVGHNPDLTDTASRLTGEAMADMPTCGVVVIEFPCSSWRECLDTPGKVVLFLRPEREDRPPT